MCPHFSTTKIFKHRTGVGTSAFYFERHTLRYIFYQGKEIKEQMRDEYNLNNMKYDEILDSVENGTLKPGNLSVELCVL